MVICKDAPHIKTLEMTDEMLESLLEAEHVVEVVPVDGEEDTFDIKHAAQDVCSFFVRLLINLCLLL